MATMALADGDATELVSVFDDALAPLVDCAALILDIRGNPGGKLTVAEAIANRFADTRRLTTKIRFRNGPRHSDFADPILWYSEPAGMRQFTGPVILLTNKYSVSAAELFTIAMRVSPKVTQMGDTTAGALASPIARELPNGWLYSLPLGLTTDHNDICYDGQGITPEIQITNDAGTIEGGTDQVLETALGRLSI
jgi:C-terminal processing protease CtpA/Prc